MHNEQNSIEKTTMAKTAGIWPVPPSANTDTVVNGAKFIPKTLAIKLAEGGQYQHEQNGLSQMI